jgi:hypothetical protein
MIKRQLKNNEILKMIRICYESDLDFIAKYHVYSPADLDECIYKSVADLILNDIKIFILENNNELIGYFGEDVIDNKKCLTGFFIVKDKRKDYKKEFWSIIINHFDNNFKVAVHNINKPAKYFLRVNGCKFIENIEAPNGVGAIFEYKGNI